MIQKYFLYIAGCLLTCTSICAQKNDANFIFGTHDLANHSCAYRTSLAFTDTSLIKTRVSLPGYQTLGEYPYTMSDRNGNMQFYCDMFKVYDAKFEEIPALGLLSPKLFDYSDGGKSNQNRALYFAVPLAGSIDEKYLLFYGDNVVFDPLLGHTVVQKLMYALVEIRNKEIQVVFKGKEFYRDEQNPLSSFAIVRHGNGKDWWLFTASNRKYDTSLLFLVSKDTITGPIKQAIAPTTTADKMIRHSLSFSLDGSKVCRIECMGQRTATGFEWYDFDRCIGVFSNRKVFRPDSMQASDGCTWSPNGRFIYGTYFKYDSANLSDPDRAHVLIQLDTWQIDPAKMCKELYRIPANPAGGNCLGERNFFEIYLAPNNKIYISSTVSGWHTIENPDSLGVACNFRFRSIQTGYHSGSIPMTINYRLYDWPDSPCDTLGINGYISVTELEHPQGNAYVTPNPASDQITIKYTLRSGQNTGQVKIFDLTGRTILLHSLFNRSGEEQMSISQLPAGLYFWSLSDGAGQVASGKVVKIE
jgi:Secretion system C-terminal sorting domain